ncbi:MAG: hypothetical protein IKN91_06550 [Paludibacteraceae bacterium]|nr:hypothetical protein [Paludibacteraceae bacterium]
MDMEKVKIVLDADVIIHFYKGGLLTFLPNILSEYEHIVLSHVRNEILYDIRSALDNQKLLLKNITYVDFAPQKEMAKEYAQLVKRFGKGESACMAYCKYTNNVVGSSNLRDIKDYCAQNNITYLTTCDFLYYAWRRQKMNIEEINNFISAVKSRGSKLPDFDIQTYQPNAML